MITRIILILLVITVAFSYLVIESLDMRQFRIGMPVKCEIGKDCFIQNYFDADASDDYKDFTCAKLSYDGHKGTDFRLINLKYMQQGYEVIAVEDGVVEASRDGMDDISVNVIGKEAIAGRECGNGVTLNHYKGYSTQYCHLMKGSIVVKPGDEIKKGDVIGKLGMSGNTEFPHLHLALIKDGVHIDPFVGRKPQKCGKRGRKALWDKNTRQKVSYKPTAILQSGFTSEVPELEEVRKGYASNESIDGSSGQIVFWTEVMGAIKGEKLRMRILDPEGKEVASAEHQFEKNQAVHFRYIGKKNYKIVKNTEYTGIVEIVHKKYNREKILFSDKRSIKIF